MTCRGSKRSQRKRITLPAFSTITASLTPHTFVAPPSPPGASTPVSTRVLAPALLPSLAPLPSHLSTGASLGQNRGSSRARSERDTEGSSSTRSRTMYGLGAPGRGWGGKRCCWGCCASGALGSSPSERERVDRSMWYTLSQSARHCSTLSSCKREEVHAQAQIQTYSLL